MWQAHKRRFPRSLCRFVLEFVLSFYFLPEPLSRPPSRLRIHRVKLSSLELGRHSQTSNLKDHFTRADRSVIPTVRRRGEDGGCHTAAHGSTGSVVWICEKLKVTKSKLRSLIRLKDQLQPSDQRNQCSGASHSYQSFIQNTTSEMPLWLGTSSLFQHKLMKFNPKRIKHHYYLAVPVPHSQNTEVIYISADRTLTLTRKHYYSALVLVSPSPVSVRGDDNI